VITEAELLKRAHEMRRNPTEPEKRLWRHLSNGQLGGFKFRRQHVVKEAYAIIDFSAPPSGLALKSTGTPITLTKIGDGIVASSISALRSSASAMPT
jgi:hypothetical protein